jgi:hypothetical protein
MLLVTTPTIGWTRSIMIIGIIWNGFNLSFGTLVKQNEKIMVAILFKLSKAVATVMF